jgi:hypothetical protein
LISWSQRSPLGTLSTDVANSGSMKPGKGALTPIAAGFLRWNAIPNSLAERRFKRSSIEFVPMRWSLRTRAKCNRDMDTVAR